MICKELIGHSLVLAQYFFYIILWNVCCQLPNVRRKILSKRKQNITFCFAVQTNRKLLLPSRCWAAKDYFFSNAEGDARRCWYGNQRNFQDPEHGWTEEAGNSDSQLGPVVLHQGTEVAATRLLSILYVMSQENAVEVLLPNLRNTLVERGEQEQSWLPYLQFKGKQGNKLSSHFNL